MMHDSQDLSEHLYPLVQMVAQASSERETRAVAEAIIAGRATGSLGGIPTIFAWGQQVYLPEEGPGSSDENDWLVAVRRIWGFAVLNMAYQEDPGDELYQHPRISLAARAGDCDDFVILLGSLLKVLGFQVQGRVVSTNGKFWEHIYLRVSTELGWMPLDPTVRDALPGWEYQNVTNVADFAL